MTRSHAWRAVVLAAVTVLAGCAGGLGPGPSTADGQSPNGTDGNPVDVSAADLPPGVSESGVDDPARLLSAHRQGLVTTGFVAEIRRVASLRGGARSQSIRTAQRVAAERDMQRYFLQAAQQTGQGTIETASWGNESLLLLRSARNNRTQYQRQPPESFNATEAVTLSTTIQQFLRLGTFETTDVRQQNGTTVVRMDSTGYTSAGAIPQLQGANITSFDAAMTVDTAGVIQALDVQLNATTSQGQVSLSTSYRLTQRSNVSIGKPDWFQDALDNASASQPSQNASDAPALDVSVRLVDGRFFEVTHAGGETLSDQGVVVVSAGEDRQFAARLGTLFRPNTTLYVYPQPDTRQLGVTTSTPSGVSVAELNGTVTISLFTQRGQPVANATVTMNGTG